MTYMILDSSGNAINAYDDIVAARAALRAIVADDEGTADHVMLLAYDDGGNPVGEAVTVADLPTQTASLAEGPIVFVPSTGRVLATTRST